MNEEPATRKDIEELRHELRQDMQAMETRLEQKMEASETRLLDRLTELMRDIETRLLTSFHGYGKGQSARMHTLESTQNDVAIRIAALEDRVLNLETGHGPRQH